MSLESDGTHEKMHDWTRFPNRSPNRAVFDAFDATFLFVSLFEMTRKERLLEIGSSVPSPLETSISHVDHCVDDTSVVASAWLESLTAV